MRSWGILGIVAGDGILAHRLRRQFSTVSSRGARPSRRLTGADLWGDFMTELAVELLQGPLPSRAGPTTTERPAAEDLVAGALREVRTPPVPAALPRPRPGRSCSPCPPSPPGTPGGLDHPREAASPAAGTGSSGAAWIRRFAGPSGDNRASVRCNSRPASRFRDRSIRLSQGPVSRAARPGFRFPSARPQKRKSPSSGVASVSTASSTVSWSSSSRSILRRVTATSCSGWSPCRSTAATRYSLRGPTNSRWR